LRYVTKSRRREGVFSAASCSSRSVAANQQGSGGLDEGNLMKNAMEILSACLMVGFICLPTLRGWLGKLTD
jgi:hypothetical protein